MTRFDAAEPGDRRKLVAEAVMAHRSRGSQFLTVEAAPGDGFDRGGEEAPPPWIQVAEKVVNLDCTATERDRLEDLLADYPEFRIDHLEELEGTDRTNVRISARADANRLAGFVERAFRTVYGLPEGFQLWVTEV